MPSPSDLPSADRRTVLKSAGAYVAGTTALSSVLAENTSAVSRWKKKGPVQYSDSDHPVDVELGVSTWRDTSDNLIPVGVMWDIDQPRSGLSWYEVRNLEVSLQPTSNNPSNGRTYSYTPWDGNNGEEDPPSALDVLESLAWEFMPQPFSIANAASDGDIYHGRDGGGCWAKWGSDIRGPRHGGLKVAQFLDSNGDPNNGPYWHHASITGDIWYVGSSFTNQVDSFSIGRSIVTSV